MNTPEHEMFRNALHSAAESIEPRSDGLDQIRARLHRRPYPLPVAWAAAVWMRLTLWLPEGAFSAGGGGLSAPRQAAGRVGAGSPRFRPEPAPAPAAATLPRVPAPRPRPTSR